ncbi:MAG: OmpA family protein [Sideroxydans sp.]|nr:OmpA family protein [Sideroxydans sp.]
MKKLVISVVLVNLLAACASQKAPEAAAPTPAPVAAAVTAPVVEKAVVVDPLNDATSILAKRSVYYALDVDAVAAADQPVIAAHGKYLSENPSRKVELAGYADERGSTEYNLALGQRRADGVKKLLELSGAKAAQVSAVSFGEEKPKAAGHDEAAWSQNRRSDLNYAK